MNRATVECPAKLNLFLSVGPRDAQGYHPLRTIFQAIDLCDTLTIDWDAPETEFVCDDPAVPTDNTVTRAASLVREIVPLPPARITLTKRIPAQSGLGGGSSDAAGYLRAAQARAGGRLSEGDLRRIATAVGADVPFFLMGGRARGEGYGQRLTPLPQADPVVFVVARPDVGCPTPEMFARLDAEAYPWREFPEDDGEVYNDFERVAPPACSALIALLRELGAQAATLTGSGSAVFGRFTSPSAAELAAKSLRTAFVPFAWVCRPLPGRCIP